MDNPLKDAFEQRSAAEFDISQLANVNILSATLFLTFDGVGPFSTNAPAIDIYGYAGNGVIQLTDMTRTSDLLYTSQPLLSVGPLPSIDVTAFVQSMAERNQPSIGFLFRDIAANSDGLFNFREGGPYLQITTSVPEPSSMVPLGCGLICLIAMIRLARAK